MTTTALTRSESIAIIQTCLHGCLGTVLHARDVLPEKAFVHKNIELGDPEQNVKMTTLEKGPSTRADHLLNWLNDGAFGALRRGELAGFQICIHADSKRRGQTLETYTFTIQYATDTDGELLPTSINLEELDDDEELDVLVNNAGKDLYKTLQNITKLCESIPDLPMERYLSMNLFLLPHAEISASIDGFNPARRQASVWPRQNGWTRQTEAFSTLSASTISTRLKISYMAPSFEGGEQQSNMEELQNYIKAVSMTEDIDWQLAKVTDKEKATQSTRRVPPNPRRPFLDHLRPLRNDDSPQTQLIRRVHGPGRRQSQISSDTQEAETQIAAAKTAAALSGMARPAEYTQGDTQVASLPPVPPQITSEEIQLQYNFSAMHHERAATTVLRAQAHELAKEIGGTTRSGQVILCHCGHSKEEGDMLRCTICHTWQHGHCYGYVDKDDPRRPTEHLCYVCFVNPRDSEALVSMIDLAVTRRAIYHALRYGIMGKGDFAEKLGMDGSIAFPIFEKFKHEGFVIAASGSHKAGFKTSGKPPWVPASDVVFGRVLDEYFHPTTNVEIYFKPYNVQPSWIKDKLVIAAVAELPAAATPMADKQKRKRAPATPASNLDSPLMGSEGVQTRGVTRRGRVYRPAEGFDDASDSDDEVPNAKHARSSFKKAGKVEIPAKDKLINLESIRIIDVGSTPSNLPHKM